MKKLDKYLIKSFVGPFIMTFFICVFVLLMQFLWKYIDEMVGKGLEWSIIGELLFYASVGLTPMAFPLATLLASIMTLGKLGEDYELVAMKASGISLMRIMRPIMIIAIGLSCFAFYCSNTILPKTNLKFNAIMRSVQRQKPEMIVKEGVFSNDIDGYSIKVDKKNKDTGMLYKLLIYDHSENQGNISVTVADSGFLAISSNKKSMVMTLFNGESCDEQDYKDNRKDKRYKFRRSFFTRQVTNIPISGFDFNETNEDNFRNSFKMQNIELLKYFTDSLTLDYRERLQNFTASLRYNNHINESILKLGNMNDSIRAEYKALKYDSVISVGDKYTLSENKKKISLLNDAISEARRNKQLINQNVNELSGFKRMINRYPMEIHRKFTWSIACLIFFFIGAPLGAIIRKGGLGVPTIISILLFIAYYIVSISGEKFSRDDVWGIESGMWFASAVFLPFGIFLTQKAVNDSDLLSSESISDNLKKVVTKIKTFVNKKNINK